MHFSVLIAIIAFGVITSYTDLTKGKIKNTVILAMLFTSLIVNIFITRVIVERTKEFLLNFMFSLLLSILLWLINVWTAADAKLFLAYSALIPLTVYEFGVYSYFPSLTILINTFTPITFFILIQSIRYLNLSSIAKEIKSKFETKEIFQSLLHVTGVVIFFNILFSLFNLKTDFLINTVLIFLVLHAIKNKKILNIFSIAIIIFGLLVFPYKFSLSFFTSLLAFFFAFQMILIVFYFVQKQQIIKVKVSDLKPDMVLAKPLMKKKTEWIIVENMSFLEQLKNEDGIVRKLTKKNIKEIKEAYKKGRVGFKEVEVVKTVAFAPLLFIGVVLTLIAKGNIFIHLITAKDILIYKLLNWIEI